MADPRPTKHRKLNDLRRSVPVVSKSALSKVLQEVAEHGLPPVFNQKAMRDAAKEDLAQWNAYGNLLQTVEAVGHKGELVPVTVVNLWSLLHASFKMGGFFFNIMKETMKRVGPSSPSRLYSLIIYCDECYPGNPLAHRSEKKMWACYCSFKEFGNEFISKEDSWLLLMVARTSLVQQVASSMSQLVKLLLLDIFHSPKGSPCDLGIALQGPSAADNCRIYFHFSIFIQDGASQKICYSVKGDSGSKFCLKCMNQTCIVLPGQADEDHAICKAIKKSDLKLSSDQQVLDSWDRLAAKYLTETSQDFKHWEQATGWTFSPHSLMHCKELRPMFKPISSYMHDWMHGMLSGGVANVVTFLVMEDLHKCGLTWQGMERYSKLWILPANYKSCKVHEIFGKPDSHRKVQKIKASASDMLTLMPILRHYVLTCGQHADCTTSCKAFEAVCEVLDLLLSTLYGKGEVTGNMIDSAVESALSLCLLAGWGDFFIKKFHWALHFGDALREHGTLIPCFSMERKHKRITSAAVLIQNLSKYEMSVYTEVLGEELHRLKHGQLPVPGLASNNKATKKMVAFVQEHFGAYSAEEIHVCNQILLCGGGKAAKQDMVLVKSSLQKWDCGMLHINLSTGDGVFSVLESYSLLEYNEKKLFAKWKATGSIRVVQCQDILVALTYSKLKDSICTLIPYHFR